MDMDQAELQEILEEFTTEAEEGLEELEQNLISLESLAQNGETDAETVDVIFRTLHTLKGGAGFLGLVRMQELAHAGENLLDDVRAGKVSVTTEVMNALFTTNDLLKELLDCTKNQEDDSSIETEAITAELKALAEGTMSPVVTLDEPAVEKNEEPAVQESQAPAINMDLIDEINNDPRLEGEPITIDTPVPAEEEKVAETPAINMDLIDEINNDPRLEGEPITIDTPVPAEEEKVVETPAINMDLIDEINNDPRLEGEPVSIETQAPSNSINEDLINEINNDPRLSGEPVKLEVASEAVVETIEATPEKMRRSGSDRRDGQDDRRKGPRRKTENAETTIRVETGRLDQVMNLVGELVLARNSLVRQLKAPENQDALNSMENVGLVTSNLDLLSRVTKDLQKSVLHTRMQPIKKVFDKIPRQVRELKSKLNREVNLIIEGEMTEVDKTLVEELSDPMVHLIRNALDHGIESKEDRVKIGKDPEGTLIVRAFYEGNNIVIQVAEDGKGMDAAKLKAKAIERGLIDENIAANMSDKDAYRLVLEAGFSTAEVVSDVSGRGVGMDVVNSKIAAIKGSIDIESELGKGTTISIYVPLTLAIVQALIVRAGCEGFAIPIGSISEVVNYYAENVHDVNGNDVMELRGEVIPIFYLRDLTKKSSMDIKTGDLEEVIAEAGVAQGSALAKSIAEGRNSHSEGYIIIVRDANMVMGVCIDGLIGQEEAVVKSITEMFDYNPAISGATITGDGSVHMILDVPFLMRDINRKGSLKI
jgi:two-component system chemotaxis sensor kinase CheA